MRRYKSSYKGTRGLKRFAVTFDGPANPTPKTPCIFCGGEVESSPVITNVCYHCYRTRIVFVGAHNAHELADQPAPVQASAAYGDLDLLQAEHDDWRDLRRTEEDAPP